MSATVPSLWLARHGETAWTLSRQHTGRTDLPLTAAGEASARDELAPKLAGVSFDLVLSSPLRRALDTARAAGFPDPQVDERLREFDYGDYEGLTTAEIQRDRPDWDLWTDGCPGGESPADVGARADRVLSWVLAGPGNVLLFSSGHFLRVLAARWVGLDPAGGRYLLLSTASLSAVGYEHNRSEPVVRFWNDTRHVSP